MFYYLSLGSNVAPEINAVNMVRSLCHTFGAITIFPFSYTSPEGIETKKHFINSLAIVESNECAELIKCKLNSIEVSLGRNRADPDRSRKDRSADLDILGVSEKEDLTVFFRQPELYISKILSGTTDVVNLSLYGLPITKGPSAVNLDAGTGNIVVIDDAHDCFVNR